MTPKLLEANSKEEIDGPSVSESFAVIDAQSANWVVRKIVEARRYAEHVQTWAAVEIRRAEREERFFLDRFGVQLETWAKTEIERFGARRRSLNLPSGTIGFRRSSGQVSILDEVAARAWCERNLRGAFCLEIRARGGEAWHLWREHQPLSPHVRADLRLDKMALAKHIRETGECPEGLVLCTNEIFFVK